MPKDFRREDHFDEFKSVGRNPFYKIQADGSLRHETEVIVDHGIEFLKSQPRDKPFALNLWFNACHAEDSDRRPGVGHFPWPKSVDGMYEDVEIAGPRFSDPQVFEAHPNFLKTTVNRERFFWRWNSSEKYQTNVRSYYRMVSGIDTAIGRFLEALAESGLAENTIVVYSADNGYYMGNRGLAGKWSHYDESLRVPLIIADPRVETQHKNKQTEAIALNLDLPATFLDWAGVDVPTRYQGHSLDAIVSSTKPANWRTESFHEHFAVRHRIPAFEGLRNERFKYVRYFDHEGYEFLHDLKNDPDELVNLVADPEYEETLNSMRQRTDVRVKELGGPLLASKKQFARSTLPHPKASAAVSARADAKGWESIFDGKSLRGWSGDADFWSVKDGALVGVTDGSLKRDRFLSWKHSTVRNFDLRVKVKVSAGGSSGIQYRGTSRPELGLDAVTGYQCEIVADASKDNGMLYELQGRRVLAHAGERVVVDASGQSWLVGEMPVKKFAAGQWHDYRIAVRGNHHQHWIGGHLAVDLIDLDQSGRAAEGVLALQLPATAPAMKIHFKDFKIKHLPDGLDLQTAGLHPIPDSAEGVRPEGDLPKDWKPPIYRGRQSRAKGK